MSKKHRTKFCFYCNNTISKKDLPLCELTKIGYKCSRCLKIDADETKAYIKMQNKIICNSCGSLYCHTYGGCVKIGTIKNTPPKKETKMKVTHFYYNLHSNNIYLITNDEKLFTTDEKHLTDIVCEYPLKDLDTPCLFNFKDEPQTLKVGLPISHLETINLTPSTKEQIRAYIKYIDKLDIVETVVKVEDPKEEVKSGT